MVGGKIRGQFSHLGDQPVDLGCRRGHDDLVLHLATGSVSSVSAGLLIGSLPVEAMAFLDIAIFL